MWRGSIFILELANLNVYLARDMQEEQEKKNKKANKKQHLVFLFIFQTSLVAAQPKSQFTLNVSNNQILCER